MIVFHRYFPVFYLFVNGVLFLVVAWLFLADPEAWFERLQFAVTQPAGAIELRTVYVGLMGGMGLFFLAASLIEQLLLAGVLLSVLGYFGVAAVRGWGMMAEGVYESLLVELLIAEGVGMALGIVALYSLYRLARRRRNPYF